MAETVATQRYSMLLLIGFAFAALVLVAIGLYGLLAFTVAQRAREIGVRMALGADRHSIVRMIFRRGLRLVVAGLALGLIASVGAVRLLSSLLYKTGSYDAVTFAVVPLVLCLVTLLACGIPAHRAARVEPVTVLRHE